MKYILNNMHKLSHLTSNLVSFLNLTSVTLCYQI